MDSALRDHLVRLALVAVVSMVAGGAVAWRSPSLRAFGLMNAAWGAVDLAIALPGLRHPHVDDAESFGRFLALNLGLNCGYVGVGATMVALAGARASVKGSGAAVALQGALLLALDGYLASAIR